LVSDNNEKTQIENRVLRRIFGPKREAGEVDLNSQG
jgi:hypothetical protein